MQARVKLELSPELLDDIRLNWLGDASSGEESNRRVRACQSAANELATDMQRQLQALPMPGTGDNRFLPLVLGYANGRSEALLRDSGECSRWAVELISLSALLRVLGPECDEDAMCGLGQRLWCQKHPSYIAGLRAADADHRLFAEIGESTGLEQCLRELQLRVAGADIGDRHAGSVTFATSRSARGTE
jgi:hypothetical protein